MRVSNTETFKKEFISLIRARYPLIYLRTFEETRTTGILGAISNERNLDLYIWSRTQGLRQGEKSLSSVTDPNGILKWIEELSGKGITVLKDFHPYLKDAMIIRRLRDLSQGLKQSKKSIVFISPAVEIPLELSKEIVLVDVPLPSAEESRKIIESAASILESSQTARIEEMIQAASGLTHDEIENVLAKSIVSKGELCPELVQEEKKQIVKKSGVLELIEVSEGSLPEVGGLQNLKDWLLLRKRGFSEEARKSGLPLPKGILLAGIPGCGKSLTAMTVGARWGLPLLRLDLGRVYSGLVGSSESNLREAIKTAEAIAPCVLWIDEIEKGLAGSKGGGDAGTSSRVFGTVLTWLQEKKSPVFVVATANDISMLPPEFLRRGRFDEIFFVDLPNEEERKQILENQLRRYGWKIEERSFQEILPATQGFSGAEIEQALISARYSAFSENREMKGADVLQALKETVPLSKTMGDQIEALRKWAHTRARLATPDRAFSQVDSIDGFKARTKSMEMIR